MNLIALVAVLSSISLAKCAKKSCTLDPIYSEVLLTIEDVYSKNISKDELSALPDYVNWEG